MGMLSMRFPGFDHTNWKVLTGRIPVNVDLPRVKVRLFQGFQHQEKIPGLKTCQDCVELRGVAGAWYEY